MSLNRRHQGGGGGFLLLAIAVGWFGFTHHNLFTAAAVDTGPAAPAQVRRWIAQADTDLIVAGVPAWKLSAADTWLIIQHESGGNSHAINLTDSNAQAGHPSKGLMQCIDSTFQAHMLPGHGNIYNPVDNIIAGVRYAVSRYGSVQNVPGVRAVRAGRAYVGY